MCREIKKARLGYILGIFFRILGWLIIVAAHVVLRAPWNNERSLMKAWMVFLNILVPVVTLTLMTFTVKVPTTVLTLQGWESRDSDNEERGSYLYSEVYLDYYPPRAALFAMLGCFIPFCVLTTVIDWVPIKDSRLKIGLIVAEVLCVALMTCFFLFPQVIEVLKLDRSLCRRSPGYKVLNSEPELVSSSSASSISSAGMESVVAH